MEENQKWYQQHIKNIKELIIIDRIASSKQPDYNHKENSNSSMLEREFKPDEKY